MYVSVDWVKKYPSSLVAEIIPHCEDDLLLHFPYEDHYNDVTCHHAIATQYGDGVSLQYDAERQGNVACFTGGTHFEVILVFTFASTQYDKYNVVSYSVLILVTKQGETKREMGGLRPKGCAGTADHPRGYPGQNILEIKIRAADPT